MGLLSSIFGSSSKSSSSASTKNVDRRVIATDRASVASERSTIDNSVRTDVRLSDSSRTDNSVRVSNANRTDNSRRTTIYNADAARINAQNTRLLEAVAGSQTDSVRVIAGMGRDSLRDLSESAAEIFENAGQNTAQAWGATIEASRDVIGDLLDSSRNQTEAARTIAAAAISGYQPTDNKLGEAVKWAAIAAAALIALQTFKRA